MNSKQCPRCKETRIGLRDIETRNAKQYIVNMKLVSAKVKHDGYAGHDVKWVCQNEKCGFAFVETKVGKELFLDYCDIRECTDIEVVEH